VLHDYALYKSTFTLLYLLYELVTTLCSRKNFMTMSQMVQELSR